MLHQLDMTLAVDKQTYEKAMAELQGKLRLLASRMYNARKSMVLVFEGWDAAGKGGAIKRLTQNIDPRHYKVYSISKPTEEEYAHHYLWRFWNKLPRAGEIAIFDRSWYGRVLVERVEGFAREEEWRRAYQEINDFENQLVRARIPVLKFFIHITKDEQYKRFREREADPFKNWKLTDEDWRNREKWDSYVEAIDEMFRRTSTLRSPWHVIEGEDKYHARLKIAQIFEKVLESALKEPRLVKK